MWFEKWRENLLSLRFGTQVLVTIQRIHLPDNQNAWIINVNNTALNLDGNNTKQDGIPTITFIDVGLPTIGITSSKPSPSTNLITECNAQDEVIPPDFQFLSIKSDDWERIWLKTVKYLKGVAGKFGLPKIKLFCVRLG